MPAPSTIRTWICNAQCLPGFTEQSFKELAARNEKESLKYKFCSLVFDEMAIKKHIAWDKNEGRFMGYVDYGEHWKSEIEATSALVFLAVGLVGRWELPIGYFFTRGLTATTLSKLTSMALIKLKESGVTALSVTCDGTIHNIRCLEMLGANLSQECCVPYFPHPSDKDIHVSVILDPSHMIKLVRNVLATEKVIIWPGKGTVKWEYIEKLHDFQESHGLRAANKLSKRHIYYNNLKMKVCLATQVFSSSVASALRLVKAEGVEGFESQDVLVTAEFIDIINNLFDVLNSKNLRATGYKMPINVSSINSLKLFFNNIAALFQLLRNKEQKPILTCRKKTGFLGFYVDCLSVQRIFHNLMTFGVQFLLTYKLSQDFVEHFFGCIRLRGGWNLNPTSEQFRYAYRRLLIHSTDGIIGENGNCSLLQLNDIVHNSLNEETLSTAITQVENLSHVCNPLHCRFCQNVIVYIAGAICKCLKPKLKCSACMAALLHSIKDPAINSLLITLKNRGGLLRPSGNLCRLLLLTEKFIRNCIKSGVKTQSVVAEILSQSNNIFTDLDSHTSLESYAFCDHKIALIKGVIKIYMTIRMNKIAKDRNFMFGERQKLNRNLVFKHL